MKNIIAISGKQYSGKDTLCDILLKKLKNFKRIGIGDAIKLEYSKQKNIELDEIIKNKHLYRKDLIELGNYGRNISSKYWLEKIFELDFIIVPDVRVVFEADFFKQNGAFLVRVNSTFENRSKRGLITEANDNTEIVLDDYKNFDVTIDNDGDLNDLIQQADKIINQYNHFIGHNLSPRI